MTALRIEDCRFIDLMMLDEFTTASMRVMVWIF